MIGVAVNRNPFIVLHMFHDKSEMRVNIEQIVGYWRDEDVRDSGTHVSFGEGRTNRIEVQETPAEIDALIDKRLSSR